MKLLPRGGFARSVSILAGGTAAAQAIVVLASPILTRLYTPEDFGLLSVYASLLTISTVIASLRYQVAIPLAADDQEAASVLVLSLSVVAGLTLISTPLILYFRAEIAATFNLPELAKYLWLLPIGLLLAGTYQAFNYWALRTRSFPVIARTKFTQAIGTLCIQIGLYFLGGVALLVGQISGQASGVATLGALALKNRLPAFKAVRFADVRRVAIRYRRFPLFSTWGTAFNIAGRQLPALLFAAFFGPAVAGLYALSHRVMAIPSRLIGRAIGDVFLSRARESLEDGSLDKLVVNVHKKLAHIAMPPVILIVLVAPQAFVLIFGQEWEMAGRFAQWLAPAIYMAFVTSPLSSAFSVLEKQVHEVSFQSLLLISRVVGLFIGARIGEPMVGIALFSIGSAICYLLFLCWLTVACKTGWWRLWSPMFMAAGWGLLLTCPLFLALILDPGPYYWLAATAVAAAAIAARELWVFGLVKQ